MKLDIFYNNLILEVTENTSHLAEPAYQTLRRYYKGLHNNLKRRPFDGYNWQVRVAPMFEILQTLPHRNQPWQILDAGCGVGTESILWAKTQSHPLVWGIDASEDRVETGQARLQAHPDISDHVTFANADVFDILQTQSFDLVWTMEALSHIDPAEQFLQAVHNNLPDNGYLVVSDSHLLNPMMAWRIWKIRRLNRQWRSEKVVNGKTISYADERLFTIGQLTRLLEKEGFRVTESHFSIFFPPQLAKYPTLFRLATTWDRFVTKIPFLRHLGGIYTVVAQKQS